MNNQCYRVIFSKVSGVMIAVSEHARSRSSSKGSSTASTTSPIRPMLKLRDMAISMALIFCGVQIVYAEIIPDQNAGEKRPDVIKNNVEQVQIVRPDQNGLSHNQYNKFTVDKQGAILNNSKDPSQTMLGGQIQGNPNLNGSGPARVILNEVTSTNISRLNGQLEVAGQKADVVISNPNGIRVNGFGFINTNRGTLTTGIPIVTGNGLERLHVTKGSISIKGKGLSDTYTSQIDLIARAVKSNANIHAGNLNIIGGAADVRYDDLGITYIKGEGRKPNIAIDTSALSGMYANRIYIVGNEDGVGVNLAGKVESGSDFTLSTNGRIKVGGSVIAKNDVNIKSKERLENAGKISAKHNLNIASDTVVNHKAILESQNGNIDIYGSNGNGSNAKSVTNDTGRISSGANITIASDEIVNMDSTFKIGKKSTFDNKTVKKYRVINDDGTQTTFDESQVKISRKNGYDQLSVIGKDQKTFNQYYIDKYKVVTEKDVIDTNNPGQIIAAGNINLTSNHFTNDKSQISASGNISIDAKHFSNIAAEMGSRTINLGSTTYHTTQKKGWFRIFGWEVGGSTTDKNVKTALNTEVSRSKLSSSSAPDNTNGMIKASHISIHSNDNVLNEGILHSDKSTAITASNDINNHRGSIISSDEGSVSLHSGNDVKNLSGVISAKDVDVTAKRNIENTTSVITSENESGIKTFSDKDGDISGNNIAMKSGQDILMNGSTLKAEKNANIVAGRDINIDTTKTGHDTTQNFDGVSSITESIKNAKGTQLSSNGNMSLSSGRDTVMHGTDLNAKNALSINSKGDVTIANSKNENVVKSHQHESSGNFFYYHEKNAERTLSDESMVKSNISSQKMDIQSNSDINLAGSNIKSEKDLQINAGHDLHISSAEEGKNIDKHLSEKTQGVLDFKLKERKIELGQDKSSDTTNDIITHHAKSTLNSESGNIVLGAGNAYNQSGSDLTAQSGNIDIHSRQVKIIDSVDSEVRTEQGEKNRVSLSVKANIDFIQLLQKLASVKKDKSGSADISTDDVAGATQSAEGVTQSAEGGKKSNPIIDYIGKTIQKLAGDYIISASAEDQAKATNAGSAYLTVESAINVINDHKNSDTKKHTSTGSSLTAGGNVIISATGDGANSNIAITNGNIHAENIHLSAENKIDLQAGQKSSEMLSNQGHWSASLGASVGFSSDAVGVMGNASGVWSKNDGNDQHTSFSNTHLDAKNGIKLSSGSDMNMSGTIATGKNVNINAGGNLSLNSLADSQDSASNNIGIGAGISAPIYGEGIPSGKLNVTYKKQHSDENIVAEQTGIRAGSDGYTINTGGNLALNGAQIQSTAEESKNIINAGTVTKNDLSNHASSRVTPFQLNIDSNDLSSLSGIGSELTRFGVKNGSITEHKNSSTVTKSEISNGQITQRNQKSL